MALCHLPNPALFTSRELSAFGWRETHTFPSASKLAEEHHLRWDAPRSPPCRALLLSCSAKKPRASRKSRTTKSNADLCTELREFVLAVGLPEGHVPSTKELLQYGRKDLAYIVRRRGYKEITKLLTNQINGDFTGQRDLADDNDFGQVSSEESIEGQETQDNIYIMPPESSRQGATSCSQNGELETVGESSHEGATSCSQNSELETVGESWHEGATSCSQNDELGTVAESEDLLIHPGQEFSSSIHITNGGHEGTTMGSQLSLPLSREQNLSRDDVSLEENLGNSEIDENEAEERANQAEIDHLRELLHQKEKELKLLKQEIEEEKFALSIMQNKAHSEISKVRNVISTKDEELHAAEESLSGLREVLIEYWGNAETVELAGSFNGWQHRVKMDPQTTLKAPNKTGTRAAILWSTILWLYPGIYEIKFIVDGHWMIDSQREFVTRGDIANNILRVER